MDVLLVGVVVLIAVVVAAVKIRRMLTKPGEGDGCGCERCELPEYMRGQCDAGAVQASRKETSSNRK